MQHILKITFGLGCLLALGCEVSTKAGQVSRYSPGIGVVVGSTEVQVTRDGELSDAILRVDGITKLEPSGLVEHSYTIDVQAQKVFVFSDGVQTDTVAISSADASELQAILTDGHICSNEAIVDPPGAAVTCTHIERTPRRWVDIPTRNSVELAYPDDCFPQMHFCGPDRQAIDDLIERLIP